MSEKVSRKISVIKWPHGYPTFDKCPQCGCDDFQVYYKDEKKIFEESGAWEEDTITGEMTATCVECLVCGSQYEGSDWHLITDIDEMWRR